MSRPGFHFSHFGMFVTDIARLEDFYTRILDFTVTDRGQLHGPHGNALSIYVPDPEGNRLELYVDLPWYVSQPMRVPIDLADEETPMQRLEDHARGLPGFRPRAQWRADMARRMGVP
jgi:catechol-2,3-dioxygenase